MGRRGVKRTGQTVTPVVLFHISLLWPQMQGCTCCTLECLTVALLPEDNMCRDDHANAAVLTGSGLVHS